MNIHSWGRLSNEAHHVIVLDGLNPAKNFLTSGKPGIAYGMGRSYGDICLNPHGTLWQTGLMDRFIAFDVETGVLRCQAGVLLRDIQHWLIPQGWMLAVSPGTQMVTVGGAIANDVHGKNHHRYGSFGHHVIAFELLRTSGERMVCTPDQPMFAATVGGLGLTGLIVEATLQLKPVNGPWLETETVAYDSLEAFFQLSAESEAGWEHTVSWIDCLAGEGRGIFMRGNPAGVGITGKLPSSKTRQMPITPPISLVNSLTLRPFNWMYYHAKRAQAGHRVEHYLPFNYPLDSLLEWNRMYGPHGFYQYQSVVPPAYGLDASRAMLKEIARSGQGSFLAVLKTFGNMPSRGMLSFPRPGVTLALDFPAGGARLQQLFTRLDAIVREAGGAIYCGKDARMPNDLFESGYSRVAEFSTYRDPGISSAMSRRLLGT